ncbi:tumor necrosis factor receptor superfamily member wengen [Topomyia yanbarensis]|uniref:tumor necrosis factor receptor superfamily member wengen n=1 Tax=Topomyia yanbarensis TaxID=2498891 RepID=UPI00273B06F3|nr:tumor necrosis factor receptor superfamily member wengen [Topomyia yanbarensis]
MPPWIGDSAMQHSTKSNRMHRHLPCSTNSGSTRPSIMYRSSNSSSDSCCGNTSNNSRGRLLELGSLVYRLRWITVVMILLTVFAAVEAVCEEERWWDPVRTECVPCTVCGEQQLVLRPCQEYMDTVCGTMKDLDMDLAQLARTADAQHEQRHWKEERRKDGHHQAEHQHDPQHSRQSSAQQHHVSSKKKDNTAEIMWDWQAASLLLAIIGCLLFFFAAAIIALNQTRQWRRIEKHFDADMEALSAQLMNHLSSMQQLENGSIFLDDVIGGGNSGIGGGGGDSRRYRNGIGGGGHHHQHHHHHHHPIEVRCVYLDQLLDGNKNCITHQGPGNLYIEENNERLSPLIAGGGGGGSGPAVHHQLSRMY